MIAALPLCMVMLAPAPQAPAWEAAFLEHAARHPRAEATDLYKFIHQSLYGPAHLIPSPEAARRYLDEELATLGTALPGEPLFEPLGDGLARLNLRPWRAAGGDPTQLVQALVATANGVKGDAATMKARLKRACILLERTGDGRAKAMKELGEAMEAKAFPVVHHSETFIRSYSPAYRVVRTELAAEALRPAPDVRPDAQRRQLSPARHPGVSSGMQLP